VATVEVNILHLTKSSKDFASSNICAFGRRINQQEASGRLFGQNRTRRPFEQTQHAKLFLAGMIRTEIRAENSGRIGLWLNC
jgi:hypothetical protein